MKPGPSWWGRGFRPEGTPGVLPPPLSVAVWDWNKAGDPFWSLVHGHLDQGGLIAGAFGYDEGFPKGWFGLYPSNPWTLSESLPPVTPPHLEVDASDARLSDSMWQAVRDALEWGDSYQVNLTARVRVTGGMDGPTLFHTLRGAQDAAYAVYLPTDRGEILSLSPELFFRRQGEYLETRPMKGTAARSVGDLEDQGVADELGRDGKTRSENLMITDLLRNDLGKICRPGSIHVPRLFTVERHPTVWQMTSSISGRLRAGMNLREIYGALFPCGSVVGAPKRATASIIQRLEMDPRGLYCGAIGWATKHESCFNVAIRTLVGSGGRYTMGIGSGLVEGSRKTEEQAEWMTKASFLKRADGPEQVFTTLRVENGKALNVARHEKRLGDSARDLGWNWDGPSFQKLLQSVVTTLPGTGTWRVRVATNPDGQLSETHGVLEPTPPMPVLALYPERVVSRDLQLYHKSFPRPFYDRARGWSTRNGFWEVFFLNELGQVTEGTVHNLMARIDGKWWTPPVSCGLLPGTERHTWVSTGRAVERVLHVWDLLDAEEIRIGNALRPFYPVKIDQAQVLETLTRMGAP